METARTHEHKSGNLRSQWDTSSPNNMCGWLLRNTVTPRVDLWLYPVLPFLGSLHGDLTAIPCTMFCFRQAWVTCPRVFVVLFLRMLLSTSGLSKYSLNGQTLAIQGSVALWGLLHLLNSALLRESSYWHRQIIVIIILYILIIYNYYICNIIIK